MTEQYDDLISIVIPTYNRMEDLRHCLSSITRQANENLEVLVIDDCSTDHTDQMMNADFPEFRYFRNKLNFGPSYARNVGIANSKGRYILFLDSDTQLQSPDMLDRFLRFFSEHPDAGTVGGEIDLLSGRIDVVEGRTVTFSGNSKVFQIPAREGNYSACDYLATCCCMATRDLIEEIGGFDPFYGFGAEDKDLGHRVRMAGYKNYLSADCAVEHRPSTAGRSKHETYLFLKTQMRFVLKCLPFHRQFLSITYWLSYILVFHLLLLPKVAVRIIRGQRLVKEHFSSGFLTFRALLENLLSARQTIAARTADFLELCRIGKLPKMKLEKKTCRYLQ